MPRNPRQGQRALAAADAPDGVSDQGFVALGVEPLADQACCGGSGRVGRRRAELVQRVALFGSDLILGHTLTALDQGLGVLLRLGDDRFRLVLRTVHDRRGLLVGRLGLGLILGLQGLGILAQRLRFGELITDDLDLAVECLADGGRHLLRDHEKDDDDHRQGDEHRRRDQPESCRRGMLGGGARVLDGCGGFSVRFSHGAPP